MPPSPSRNRIRFAILVVDTILMVVVCLLAAMLLMKRGGGQPQLRPQSIFIDPNLPSSTPFRLQASATQARTALPPPTGTSTPVLTPTLAPTATLAPTPVPTATPVRIENGRYIVQPGDSLDSIAAYLGSSPDNLRAANFMFGDGIQPGQLLIIPEPGVEYAPRDYHYSSLDKDTRDINYPLVYSSGRFAIHYAPNTYPATDLEALARLVEQGMVSVENTFGQPFPGRFDVYAAGSLYEPPERYLLGKSVSADRYVFSLHDGSGDTYDQQYLTAHELTHMYAWNMFGQPVSFLVSEGAAVYSGMQAIASSGQIPIMAFCQAFYQEGRLPWVGGLDKIESWRGHNNNLENYYTAGCLVQYLIETYGVDKFGAVYSSNDYAHIYGKDLLALETEFRASFDRRDPLSNVDTRRLVASTDTYITASRQFYNYFNASPQHLTAYRWLDLARVALMEGRLDEFDRCITEFHRYFY